MNISISLFKTKGLTKQEVDSITEQLTLDIKKLNSELEITRSNVQFWKDQMKKRHSTKKCFKCEEQINVWPFEDSAYYVDKNKVWHKECYNITINKQKKEIK